MNEEKFEKEWVNVRERAGKLFSCKLAKTFRSFATPLEKVFFRIHWAEVGQPYGWLPVVKLFGEFYAGDSGESRTLAWMSGCGCRLESWDKADKTDEDVERALTGFDDFKAKAMEKYRKIEKVKAEMKALGYLENVTGNYFRSRSPVESSVPWRGSLWFCLWGEKFSFSRWGSNGSIIKDDDKDLKDLDNFVPMVLQKEKEVLGCSDDRALDLACMPEALRMRLIEEGA